MRLLSRQEQQQSFRQLVEIIKVLATVDSRDAIDAITDAYNLAETIGVQEDLYRIAGKGASDA